MSSLENGQTTMETVDTIQAPQAPEKIDMQEMQKTREQLQKVLDKAILDGHWTVSYARAHLGQQDAKIEAAKAKLANQNARSYMTEEA